MKTIKIEIAKPDQFEEIAKLHELSFKDIGESSFEFMNEIKNKNTKSVLLVATQNKKIIGYLKGIIGENSFLEWIAVFKEGKGAGQALVDKFKRLVKQKKGRRISLKSRNRFKRALMFYIANGWEIIGVEISPDKDLMINFSIRV